MFKTELRVKAIRGTGDRELETALVYETKDGKEIVVPKGFKTNYASIPKFLRWFIDQDGPTIRDISVIHDYLYSQGNPYKYTRAEADAILFQGMREAGAWWIKAALVWLAVRLFGGLHQRLASPAPSRTPEEKQALGFAFYALMFTAALIILTPLALSGCSITGIAKAKAGQHVQAYCGQTQAERAAFRAVINEAIHPNTINLECVDNEPNG